LVRAVPRLQILVGALLKAIPSMLRVVVAVSGLLHVRRRRRIPVRKERPVSIRRPPDGSRNVVPSRDGRDWSTTLNAQRYGCNVVGYGGREALCTQPTAYPILAPIYFISFILVGTMVTLNLFIGVIMKGMEEAQDEQDERAERDRLERTVALEPGAALDEDLKRLEDQIAGLTEAVRTISIRARARVEEG
jgi:voltage-gated sodium channel